MRIKKISKNVLISSFNFEGHCDLEWTLVIDDKDLSLSIEIPYELVVNCSRYDEQNDLEIPYEQKIKYSKIKLTKFEVYPNEALDLKKLEITGETARVIL